MNHGSSSNLKIWEDIYSSGRHLNRYPWDSVVSFIYRFKPNVEPRSKVNVLEIGFGSGSNLWFAAREGFSVFGVEFSPSAVEFATNRFKSDSLSGNLRLGDFCSLPF